MLRLCVHSQYDPENSGFISTERFRDLLATHGSELDPHKLEVLLALADGNADGKICYQDFVNLVRCFNLSWACLDHRSAEINSPSAPLTSQCVPKSMFSFHVSISPSIQYVLACCGEIHVDSSHETDYLTESINTRNSTLTLRAKTRDSTWTLDLLARLKLLCIESARRVPDNGSAS